MVFPGSIPPELIFLEAANVLATALYYLAAAIASWSTVVLIGYAVVLKRESRRSRSRR